MENVILIIHLILAVCLICVVLLQRSEGGGIGLGGGGGGLMTGRQAATALGKLTWVFAVAFLMTSVTLTIIAAQNSGNNSLLDEFGNSVPGTQQDTNGQLPPASDLLPPISNDAPALPPRAE
jgi:preprotein translocase subunit SecG